MLSMRGKMQPADIVMIGSSIFEFWGQPQWGALTIKNCAIRSTQSQDWLNNTFDHLPPHKNMLIYCGSNDLIFGNSPEQIVENVCALLDKVSHKFPKVRLGYFSIMQCPQKRAANQITVINNINREIASHCNSSYDFFNFNDFIENDEKWFLEDGLHLTQAAYIMLNQQLAPVINQWVNKTPNK